MENQIKKYSQKIFEDIKHIDEDGIEFWYARELQEVLEYAKWENFHKAIIRAMDACETSKNEVYDHFAEVRKMVEIGSKTKREVEDFKFTRYACYLIVQNGDPRKEAIALGQTYFAVQTRKQELTEQEYALLSEDEKRFFRRRQTKDGNLILYKAAKEAGVKNFDKFTNFGYKGLYKGETANDIAKRKGLRYREDILDNMSSEELGANIFRITQTEAKLKRDNIKTEGVASQAHFEVGTIVREAIEKMGGTMPEDLPTPKKSLKELEKIEKRLISQTNIKKP